VVCPRVRRRPQRVLFPKVAPGGPSIRPAVVSGSPLYFTSINRLLSSEVHRHLPPRQPSLSTNHVCPSLWAALRLAKQVTCLPYLPNRHGAFDPKHPLIITLSFGSHPWADRTICKRETTTKQSYLPCVMHPNCPKDVKSSTLGRLPGRWGQFGRPIANSGRGYRCQTCLPLHTV